MGAVEFFLSKPPGEASVREVVKAPEEVIYPLTVMAASSFQFLQAIKTVFCEGVLVASPHLSGRMVGPLPLDQGVAFPPDLVPQSPGIEVFNAVESGQWKKGLHLHLLI